MARSGKWYRKNEADVMNKLGLKETKGSGAGWIEKEDGENEFILAQLKSTDSESVTMKMLDWRKLVFHANTSHKIPVFVNEKIGEEIFITVRLSDIKQVSRYLSTGKAKITCKDFIPEIVNEPKQRTSQAPKIKSSSRARDKFWKEREELFKNRNKRR